MRVFILPGTCFEEAQTRPHMYVGIPADYAAYIDLPAFHRRLGLRPLTHSTAIGKQSESVNLQ